MQDVDFLICSINAARKLRELDGVWGGGLAGYENSGEINFRVEDKKGAMDAIRDHFTAIQKPTAMMDFDGYRVEFSDWWFNIRPSNTEPYLRFICEASSAELLKTRIEEVKEILFTRFGATL